MGSMSLPLIDSRRTISHGDFLRQFAQAEERWTEHLGEGCVLEVGTAYSNPRLGGVFEANNIRQVCLPEGVDPGAAFEMVMAHYQERKARCAYWVMSASGPESAVRPMAEFLVGRGYRGHPADVMLWTGVRGSAVSEAGALTIIPARASFRHVRVLAEDLAREWKEPQLAEAFMLHLDDPHWDALLALRDGEAAGYIGVLGLGEVGRIDQLYVAERFRGRGVGRTMLSRVLEICARSLFRHVMVSFSPDSVGAVDLYRNAGFERIGQTMAYVLPNLRMRAGVV